MTLLVFSIGDVLDAVTFTMEKTELLQSLFGAQ